MIVKIKDMVAAEAEILCEQTISVQLSLCVDKSDSVVAAALPTPIASDAVSINLSIPESAKSCPTSIQTALVESPAQRFIPSIRSGSHTDIGPRRSNEDEHIRIDDLSSHLGSLYKWPLPSSFYAVFDGHGGADAATYVKDNAMRFFFDDSYLPHSSNINDTFLEELESCHCKAFLLADRALADECSVSDYCGTTALTALILGEHLLIANAGDCRAVLCRKGVAVPLSQDHRPTYLPEKERVEQLGGFIEDGYLNGELAVTRALGDWYMKTPSGSEWPLTANPDVQKTVLSKEDEFLIIGCDGIWDVMSNEEAIRLVRRELKLHDDPQRCARELVNQALRLDTSDNLTAIVVCFSSSSADCQAESAPRQRPRFRFCMSEEGRNRLRNLLEGN